MRTIILCLALAALITPSLAFWSTGHMIIAKIAEEELAKMNPHVLEMVVKDIKEISQFSKEKDHNLVESSTWADDNKGVAWMAFNGWHFVDSPVIEEGFEGEVDFDMQNATWALNQASRTLKDTRKPSFDNGLARSFMARYLVHIVGDLHQPLHASAYYGSKFPKGDRGGNSWKVTYNKEISNLHALWDSCLDQYGSIWTPIGEKEWGQIEGFASNLTSEFTRSKVSHRLKSLKFSDWAEESNNVAKQYVYTGIEPNATPSKEYMERGRAAINEQLAVGGYRLADILIEVYKGHKGNVQTLMDFQS